MMQETEPGSPYEARPELGSQERFSHEAFV
ncbi:MAG: hypothetical protein QOJ93_2756 [Actinomycetota bacterium]|nr:hypothetical protein [Actinomycetota bacterium]